MNHRPRPPLGSPPPFSSPLAFSLRWGQRGQESYGNVIVFLNIRPSNHVPSPSQSWLLNVYPIVPNGFADHEIPMKNGYKSLGRLTQHFQTNPNPNHGAQPIPGIPCIFQAAKRSAQYSHKVNLALFPGAQQGSDPTGSRLHTMLLPSFFAYGLSQDWCCGARRKGPA